MITASMTIGGAVYPTVGEFRLVRRRGWPLTVLTAEVPLGPATKGEKVSLRYGYAEPVEWAGMVTNIDKGGDLMTVTASGADELKLTETLYCESFIDETAGAIVKSALSATGLPVVALDAPGVTVARFTADTVPVWQAVRQVEETLRKGHGLAGYALWLGAGGLCWTTGDAPGTAPEIATGVNLIDHAPGDAGLSKVTTFMLPGLTHSRRFTIRDTRRGITGTYRAEQVEHTLKDVRARTIIYYRRDS